MLFSRRLWLVAASALPLTLLSFSPADDDKDAPYQTKSFSGNITNVQAETSGGSLSVESTSGSGVKVEMFVRGNNWPDNKLSKEEIEERLKDWDVSIRQEGSTVVASAKRRNNNGDWNWKRSVSIAFKIYTPKTMNTDLRTSGGSIKLAGLSGSQKFRTSGGSLSVQDMNGNLDGRTSGGSIKLEKCRATSGARIDLQTSGGSITARDSEGDIDLQTSGGSLNLLGLKGKIEASTSGGSVTGDAIEGDLRASTSGGSVRLRGIAGSLDASTSGGGMDVDIARLGQYVRLSNSSGSVRVRLPLDKGMDLDLRGNRVNVPELARFDGNVEKDRVRGRLNGGGVPVTISAGSGSVSLNQ